MNLQVGNWELTCTELSPVSVEHHPIQDPIFSSLHLILLQSGKQLFFWVYSQVENLKLERSNAETKTAESEMEALNLNPNLWLPALTTDEDVSHCVFPTVCSPEHSPVMAWGWGGQWLQVIVVHTAIFRCFQSHRTLGQRGVLVQTYPKWFSKYNVNRTIWKLIKE